MQLETMNKYTPLSKFPKMSLSEFMAANKSTDIIIHKQMTINRIPLPKDIINYICEHLFLDHVQVNTHICKNLIKRTLSLKNYISYSNVRWMYHYWTNGFYYRKYGVFIELKDNFTLKCTYCAKCGGSLSPRHPNTQSRIYCTCI